MRGIRDKFYSCDVTVERRISFANNFPQSHEECMHNYDNRNHVTKNSQDVKQQCFTHIIWSELSKNNNLVIVFSKCPIKIFDNVSILKSSDSLTPYDCRHPIPLSSFSFFQMLKASSELVTLSSQWLYLARTFLHILIYSFFLFKATVLRCSFSKWT